MCTACGRRTSRPSAQARHYEGFPPPTSSTRGLQPPDFRRRIREGASAPRQCPPPLRRCRSRCRHLRGVLAPALRSRCCHRSRPARTPTPWWLPSVLRTDGADAFAVTVVEEISARHVAPGPRPKSGSKHLAPVGDVANATVRIRGAPRRVISPAHSIRSPAGPADVAVDETKPGSNASSRYRTTHDRSDRFGANPESVVADAGRTRVFPYEPNPGSDLARHCLAPRHGVATVKLHDSVGDGAGRSARGRIPSPSP